MSGTPINLNRARKDRARKAARKTADENAVRFGRTKEERAADKARKERANQFLDGHKTRDDEA